MNKSSSAYFKKVKLPMNSRNYEIIIGSELIPQIGKWVSNLFYSKRAYIIADIKLNQYSKNLVQSLAKCNWETYEISVHGGEGIKDFKSIYPLYGELLKMKANRDSVLFALGGGSVGDAAGFIASTYMRGIPWVGIPTTLLAQVDSAIGGKTAINHIEGKNLIGSFYQPNLVICDTVCLKTLSRREIISGLGEIIKYGIIYDPQLLYYISRNLESILNLDNIALSKIIKKSVEWKSRAVKQDEFDRKGIREVLNFGHTFGHALEAVTRYKSFQHGEAVIWGMRFALALSEVRALLRPKESLELDALLARLEIPKFSKKFNAAKFVERMMQDKKVRNGKIHFVLLKKTGQPATDSNVTFKDIQQAFHLLTNRMSNGRK